MNYLVDTLYIFAFALFIYGLSARPATMRIQLIDAVSRILIRVAMTAIPIPAAAIQLPRTAVLLSLIHISEPTRPY